MNFQLYYFAFTLKHISLVQMIHDQMMLKCLNVNFSCGFVLSNWYHQSTIKKRFPNSKREYQHYNYFIIKSPSMFLHLLLICLSNLLPILADVACIPQSSPSVCVLTWETNTGPSDSLTITPVWANAYIYSSTCLGWGSTTDGLGTDVRVYAWGLDLANPLVLNTEQPPGFLWDTPVFTYQGITWDYLDCSCSAEQDIEIHECVCPFLCVQETWD